jgi:hypothetical protein
MYAGNSRSTMSAKSVAFSEPERGFTATQDCTARFSLCLARKRWDVRRLHARMGFKSLVQRSASPGHVADGRPLSLRPMFARISCLLGDAQRCCAFGSYSAGAFGPSPCRQEPEKFRRRSLHGLPSACPIAARRQMIADSIKTAGRSKDHVFRHHRPQSDAACRAGTRLKRAVAG